MNCRAFEDRLNLLLDERQLPQHDARLQAHAQGCAACGQMLQAQASLLAGLELFEQPSLTPHFSDLVLTELADAPQQPASAIRRFSGRRGLVALAALAAALLVAVALNFQFRESGNAARSPAVAQRQPTGVQPHKRRRAAGPLLGAVRSQPASSLSKSHSQQLMPAESSAAVPYGDYRAALHGLAMRLPAAVEQLETVEAYAPGIRPVRASFNVAIDTLRRTLPGNSDGHPGIPQAGLSLGSADAAV
jgi:hypothetical protein